MSGACVVSYSSDRHWRTEGRIGWQSLRDASDELCSSRPSVGCWARGAQESGPHMTKGPCELVYIKLGQPVPWVMCSVGVYFYIIEEITAVRQVGESKEWEKNSVSQFLPRKDSRDGNGVGREVSGAICVGPGVKPGLGLSSSKL